MVGTVNIDVPQMTTNSNNLSIFSQVRQRVGLCFAAPRGSCILSAMQKSLEYLPKQKREELERIASIIRAACLDVEMIILFGSYARGNYKEEADLDPNRKSGHASDYDILVVTKVRAAAEDGLLWRDISTQCERSGLSTHVRIIARDIEFVNMRLAEGQYFFSDVKREGRMLYDSGNFRLARKRKLTPAEQERTAQDQFAHWFERATEFMGYFEIGMEKAQHKSAAFHLHQVAEACYKAVLVVFTNYIPNEHFLAALGMMAAMHDAAFEDVFPTKTREEDRLFRLLDYAYIGARYDPAYMIFEDELAYLSERVRILLELTEKRCKAKIENLAPDSQ